MSILPSSRIDLDGGVLGIDWTFTRSLGTSSNQIRWLPDRDGGFASYNGTRSVTLGSAGSVVTVGYSGEGHFVNADSYLIFGAYDASGTVAFQNKLGLFSEFHPIGWGPNRIRVINYVPPPGTNPPVDVLGLPNASVDFRYSFETPEGPPGSRTTSYNLYFEGDGRADITQPHEIYSVGSVLTGWVGDFVKVRGAHLVLRQQGNIPLTLTTAKFSQVEVYHGGSITLDNRSQYVGNRINDAVDIGLYSGKFVLSGNLTTHVTETVNDLNLYLGANTVSLLTPAFPNTPTAFTRTVSLRFNSLQMGSYWDHNDVLHDDERPTVNFTSNSPNPFAAFGWPTGAHRLSFATKPSELGGILPYATINGRDWARTVADDGRYYLTAYTGYQTNNQTTWTANTVNAAPSSNQTVNANRSVNSLKLESGRTITIQNSNNVSLSVARGILSIGSAMTKIQGGTLALGPSAFSQGPSIYVHIYNSASVGLDISSSISIPGRILGRPSFVKTGTGTLLLSGDTGVSLRTNGIIYIHEGTLALSKTGTGRVTVGSIIVGDHAGVDVLRLDNHQQIVSTVNLTLRGGHPDPARFLMAEGVLRYNGINGSGVGIRQTINNLHIEGRGVVDFRGGEVGRANFLIINGNISFGEDSKLFIRNWYEYEDYILIRRNGAGLVNLDNIVFEGYGPAIFRAWDGIYWQITPAPEPTTYGAILGAMGIGLVVWRGRIRRTQRKD